MQELMGDIFKLPSGADEALCVTTNGRTNSAGQAVMGAGIAKQARDRYIGIDGILGIKLMSCGNHVFDLGIYEGYHVLSYPTKDDWRNPSDIDLIERSAKELVMLSDVLCLKRVYLSRPGCGMGGLSWVDVSPRISGILDDRFIIVSQL